MNILSLSYTNIGPFADQTKTVTFHEGSTIVSAPIGSGKSFLFFDGPLFALYKYSSRPMLSRTCKQGTIRAIFYYESQWYLIQRQLKPTKSGNDSVQSRLWTISVDPTERFISHATIEDGERLWDLVEADLEEIEFTSGRELDDAMKNLLPPRELIQSVYLLMQESDHVFELPPSQRINVFKHLFGLIGIDEAKNILAERRKELTTTEKLLQDDTQVTTKFQKLINGMREKIEVLNSLKCPDGLETILMGLLQTPTFQDIRMIEGEITLQGFTIESGLDAVLVQASDQLRIAQKQSYETRANTNATQRRIDEYKKNIESLILQKKLLIQKIEKATVLYAQIDEQRTAKKQELVAIRKQNQQLQNVTLDGTVYAIEDLALTIQNAIQDGKELAYQIELLSNQKITHEQKVKTLNEDIVSLDQQLESVSQKYEQQMYFECDKIQGPCPYVDVIKGAAVKSLQQQKQLLSQQKEIKHKQLSELQDDYKKRNIEQKIHELQQQKQEKGKTLARFHRKETMQQYENYDAIKKQSDMLVQMIEKLEVQREQIQLEDPAILGEKQAILDQQIQETQQLYDEAIVTYEKFKQEYIQGGREYLDQRIEGVQLLYTLVQQLQELLEMYREKHQKIQAIQDELKRNKELHAIFSKELMVVALQDFLPSLETVINSFLDEVVDYQIRFLTPETVSDSLELDIEIHDYRGVRQVRSLSGGQRATLKIARILAVSSLFNGQFLFLDETITSLDSEAVARIGRLLEMYMKKRETKLLLVTHATQIKTMDMRERVVQV